MNVGEQYIDSYTGFNGKMQTLKRKCETMCNLMDDIRGQLQREESSPLKKPRKEVEDLLGKMEKTINKVESMEEEVSRTRRLLACVKLSNPIKDLTKDLDEHLERVQVYQAQGFMLDVYDEVELSPPKLVGQALQRILETILEHLRKDEVLSIGIWGMGGVGKTTLAEHVHNRIKEQSGTFEHVYWITVSQNPSVSKLQDDIAKAIHFEISHKDSERIRAGKLSGELKRRFRTVLILDDVWDGICLECGHCYCSEWV